MNKIIFGIAFFLMELSASVLPAGEHQEAIIAVAANFMGAMEKLVATYEEKTGIKIQEVYSSTGKLYAQIKNGAPYDLFFAADGERPNLLAKEGLCEEPFVYAVGEPVLWTKNRSLLDEKHWHDVVAREDINKIAVSIPQTAPYGAAALAAVKKKGLTDAVENKLVYGQNVAQAFQFAFHGSADLGFTSLSFALSDKGKQGIYWQMPEAEKVVQKGCVVKATQNEPDVEAFLKFFHDQSSKSIMNEFGYK